MLKPCCFAKFCEVTFLLLVGYFRPTLKFIVEQPLSSWLFKQRCFQEIIARYNLKKYLTYQGAFGAPLLKGTHLMSDMDTLTALVRKATRQLKEKHALMMCKKNARRQAKGLPIKVYYKQYANGTFHGTSFLTETSQYPGRFVTAIYKCWAQAYASCIELEA